MHRTPVRLFWALSALCFPFLTLTAADATFSTKPTVTKDGVGARISFTVSAPTDVEVAVLDATGKVLRHLAAGVLGGKNPPPAPLKPGLAQELIWDGKDDSGAQAGTPSSLTPATRLPAVAPGAKGHLPPFSIRVRTGLNATFDGFLLHEPDAFPQATSLAVATNGEVHVFYQDPTANGNQGGHKVRVIDRTGKYLRQILPFPATLPYEKVKASGAFQDEQGRIVPRTDNWHSLRFYPDTVAARGRSMSNSGQPVVDSTGRLFWVIGGGRLCAIDGDGGLPYDTFMSEPLAPGFKNVGGKPALCVSSDGKSLYLSGMTQADDGYGKNVRPIPAVWRIDRSTRQCEVFLGDPTVPGTDKDRFTSPRGVAAAQGLLYVADSAAGRVAVFKESDKSPVGEIKCVLPHLVQVHPGNGAVYICSYVPESNPRPDGKSRITDAHLLKFAGYKDEKPVSQMALPKTGLSPNDGTHRIALDASSKSPLIWAPGLPYAAKGSQIACYRDMGDKFEPAQLPQVKTPWGNGPRDVFVDRARNELYVKVQGEQWHQFDEKTGKLIRTIGFKNVGGPRMNDTGSQLGLDSVGNYITHAWGKGMGLQRWTHDIKPLNWEGKDSNRTDWGAMMTFQQNYMAILKDEIYVIKPVSGPHNLEVYDMGLNVKRRVIWNARRGSCPRLDAKGNIYITVPIRPIGRDFPEFFDGKLGKVPDYYNNIGPGDYWYVYMYGSIVKFPPQGGAFYWPGDKGVGSEAPDLPAELAAKPREKHQFFLNGHNPHKIGEVQGADWVRFGYSPYSETYSAGTPVCMCEGTGFDVDPYGRIFFPNLCQFRIEVIDNNNNNISQFGQYGNQDDGRAPSTTSAAAAASGGTTQANTPIPLAWPTYVAVSDTHAYVSDTIGLRVVKVKLGAAAQETVEIN